VFSGGAQVTGWTEVNSAENIWGASLPSGVSTRSLWVNGTRATLVQGGGLPSGTTQTSTGFTVPGDALQSLSDPADLEMVFKPGNWVESECGVSSISGITFQDTTWLQPNGPDGMIDAQADLMQGSVADAENWSSATFVTPTSGATWDGIPYGSDAVKMPGAVEVHAGHGITFSGDTFTHLGAAGLDMDGGTQNSYVTGNTFTDISGNGVQLGTVATPNQSNTALIDSGDTISDNYISGAAVEYQGGVGIWAGYVKDVDITHNEIANAAYSGISIGWGWGSEDTLPTIDTGNQITDNYIHDVALDRQDGGAIYNLGPQPDGVISGNYIVDDTNVGAPIYLDQGSTDYTVSGNVEQNVVNDYLYLDSNSFDPTDTVHATGNYTTATSSDCGNAVVSGTTESTNAQWPAAAQAIIVNAGLAPAYRYLTAATVPSPYSTYSSVSDTFAQDNGEFLITGAGADAWGAGGESYDQYGSIYQSQSFASGSTMTARVDSESDTSAWAKAGLAVRDSMTGAGSSNGYAVLALTPGNGVTLQWEDSAGDGYLDQEVTADAGASAPEWLRLTRSGSTLTGYYSSDGSTWTQIGSTITLYSPTADLDAGMFWTAHDASTAGVAAFNDFSLTNSYTPYAATPADIDQEASGAVSLQAAGTDVWNGGGVATDQYAALYKPSGADSTSTTTVEVTGESDTNAWQKAGIMLRDSIPGQTTSLGYAVIAITPGEGVTLQWDDSSSGYLNNYVTAATGTTAPIWLRLVRSGTNVTGEYSTNDSTWSTVATETLTGSNTAEDIGMFTTSHLTSTVGQATFSGFTVTG
jgi:regulation of enolase protein 1 (concanavalin A-like superfamily)